MHYVILDEIRICYNIITMKKTSIGYISFLNQPPSIYIRIQNYKQYIHSNTNTSYVF